MFRVCILSLCALAATMATAGAARAEAAHFTLRPGALMYKGVPLEKGRRFGPLEFRGAYDILSDHPRFGGVSSIGWTPDKKLLLLTDQGHLATLPIGDKQLSEINEIDGHIAPLLSEAGLPLKDPYDDSEGMAAHDEKKLLIAFERHHRWVWYDRATLKPMANLPLPDEITRQLQYNSGIETIAEMRPGTVLGISEMTRDRAGNLKGWMIDTNRLMVSLILYRNSAGYTVTGVAHMPDEKVLLLERGGGRGRHRARLLTLPVDALYGKKELSGKLLVEFGGGSGVRSMEDLATRRLSDTEMQVFMVSDNNFEKEPTLLVEWIYRADKPAAQKPSADSGSVETLPEKP